MSPAVIELSLASFASRISKRFRVGDETGGFDLVLTEAEPLPRHQPGVAEKFSLVFQGPLIPALPQRMHRLHPGDAEALDLFLVPIASKDPGVRQYQAIINREVG